MDVGTRLVERIWPGKLRQALRQQVSQLEQDADAHREETGIESGRSHIRHQKKKKNNESGSKGNSNSYNNYNNYSCAEQQETKPKNANIMLKGKVVKKHSYHNRGLFELHLRIMSASPR